MPPSRHQPVPESHPHRPHKKHAHNSATCMRLSTSYTCHIPAGHLRLQNCRDRPRDEDRYLCVGYVSTRYNVSISITSDGRTPLISLYEPRSAHSSFAPAVESRLLAYYSLNVYINQVFSFSSLERTLIEGGIGPVMLLNERTLCEHEVQFFEDD
jgi:hypothetical protein